MSRPNDEVVGAQQAVTGTFATLATGLVPTVVTLTVMAHPGWRLMVFAVAMVSAFIVASRRVNVLAGIAEATIAARDSVFGSCGKQATVRLPGRG